MDEDPHRRARRAAANRDLAPFPGNTQDQTAGSTPYDVKVPPAPRHGWTRRRDRLPSRRVGVNVGYAPLSLVGSDAVQRREAVALADAVGLDHLTTIDHVSFRDGFGIDGLTYATSVLSMSDRLHVSMGVYLLALRHPMVVARQLADLYALAPGRFSFGVGVGGEDRNEFASSGVDPATRGRRTDEALVVLRALLAGGPVDHAGEFFDLRGARIRPAPGAIPIMVGGRSDAALARAGRHGDGWLGVWVSPRRYGDALQLVADHATGAGRDPSTFRHSLCLWCGFHDDRNRARSLVASAMEGLYGVSFDVFEKWTPFGTPEEVADFARPYVEAGCEELHLYAIGEDVSAEIEAAAEVRRLLRS
jgi:alkanesulfonate monooxygenase SsuD/methylene tetrahydromethanopterin reductase-like flavin-dependent oxidoreductase (luciferase family)